MENELMQVTVPALQMLLIVGAAWLYSRGGRPGGRVFRRYLCPLAVSLSCWLGGWLMGSFQLTHLAIYPLISLVMHMGYSDSHGRGGVARIRNAMMILLPGLVLALSIGTTAWVIFGLHAGAALLSLGSLSILHRQTFDAPIEEYVVSFLMFFPFPLYTIIKL